MCFFSHRLTTSTLTCIALFALLPVIDRKGNEAEGSRKNTLSHRRIS